MFQQECLPARSLPSSAAKPSGVNVLMNTVDVPVSAPPNMLIPTLLLVDCGTRSTTKSPPAGDVGENTVSSFD